jgi:hypothetical protein
MPIFHSSEILAQIPFDNILNIPARYFTQIQNKHEVSYDCTITHTTHNARSRAKSLFSSGCEVQFMGNCIARRHLVLVSKFF